MIETIIFKPKWILDLAPEEQIAMCVQFFSRHFRQDHWMNVEKAKLFLENGYYIHDWWWLPKHQVEERLSLMKVEDDFSSMIISVNSEEEDLWMKDFVKSSFSNRDG